MNDCNAAKSKTECPAPVQATLEPWLIPIEDVAVLMSVSQSTAERMHASGELPAPVGLGRRLLRWDVEELQAWIKRRKPDGRTLNRKEWAAVRAAKR